MARDVTPACLCSTATRSQLPRRQYVATGTVPGDWLDRAGERRPSKPSRVRGTPTDSRACDCRSPTSSAPRLDVVAAPSASRIVRVIYSISYSEGAQARAERQEKEQAATADRRVTKGDRPFALAESQAASNGGEALPHGERREARAKVGSLSRGIERCCSKTRSSQALRQESTADNHASVLSLVRHSLFSRPFSQISPSALGSAVSSRRRPSRPSSLRFKARPA